MDRFVTLIAGAAIALGVTLTAAAVADTIQTDKSAEMRDNTGNTGGTVIDDLSLSSARYTGWIQTKGVDDVVLEVDWTDDGGGTTCTQIDWKCWTDRVNNTADGSGYDLDQPTSTGTAASPVSTVGQHVWTRATASTSDQWVTMITDVPSLYLNCEFACSAGTADANDKISVYARGVTP